jgi:hypothetical protein
MSIGILTSTKFTNTPLEDAFKSGLGPFSGTPFVPKEANGAYGGGVPDLENKIQELVNDHSVNMIVCAGGLVSAFAAVNKQVKKPFLVSIGNIPDDFDLDPNNANYKYCGGINLDTVNQNLDRRTYLLQHFGGIDPAKVVLMYNEKSRMGKIEKNAWTSKGWPVVSIKNNNVVEFPTAFNDAKTKGHAVIVSGDPFFTNKKAELVTQGNASQLTVCYPFDAYDTANPKTNISMRYGPSLSRAYGALGRKAAQILTALTANPPTPAPFTGLDTLVPAAPRFF